MFRCIARSWETQRVSYCSASRRKPLRGEETPRKGGNGREGREATHRKVARGVRERGEIGEGKRKRDLRRGVIVEGAEGEGGGKGMSLKGRRELKGMRRKGGEWKGM